MSAKILQVNFRFDGSRKEFEHAFDAAAKPIADTPGVRWKIWAWGDAEREFGGTYLFDDN